jgi:hypothetical protein
MEPLIWLTCLRRMLSSLILSARLLVNIAMRRTMLYWIWSTAHLAGKITPRSIYTRKLSIKLMDLENQLVVQNAQQASHLMEILLSMSARIATQIAQSASTMVMSVIWTNVLNVEVDGRCTLLNKDVWRLAAQVIMKLTLKLVINAQILAKIVKVTNSIASNVTRTQQPLLFSLHLVYVMVKK